jgi:hypothetical protein
MEPRYPYVIVELVGRDGNAFAILGRVVQALSEAGVPDEELRGLIEEATCGDHEHLLQVILRWVEVII